MSSMALKGFEWNFYHQDKSYFYCNCFCSKWLGSYWKRLSDVLDLVHKFSLLLHCRICALGMEQVAF